VAAHLSPATKKCDAGIQKLACPKVTNNCVLVETDVHLLAGRRPRPDNSVFHTPASASGGCPNVYVGGGIRNVRVNQDCSLRRQAEEVIAINPTNSDNLIVGQNDSRIGFNHCGYDFSFDGGKTWADQTPPFYQFINNDGGTFDACSDPTATFDSGGNAYVGGVLFEIFYADSAFLVAKSNAGIGGAFYHTPFPLSMIVKCPASADCSNPTSWSAPVHIVDDIGVQPSAGCGTGRQCLPPNSYRIDDANFGSLSVDNNGTLYHVFSDIRNGTSNCTFSAATPCDQDVFIPPQLMASPPGVRSLS